MTSEQGPGEGTRIVEADREALLEHLADGEVARATALLRAVLARGVRPDEVIADLLAPTQQRVGQEWEIASWGVAREHAATAITETLLSLVAADARTTGWRGRVVVACVEQELHSLPARMVNERLRLRGWETVFLGSATPGPHLRAYLRGEDDVVGLVASCQVGSSLVGAVRTVRAAHDAGVPVVVGGRGLGDDERRAVNLGADAWAAGVDQLDALLEQWTTSAPTALGEPATDDAEHLLLLADADRVVGAAIDEVLGRHPQVGAWPGEEALVALRDDARLMLEFVAAAVLASDHRLVTEFVDWLGSVLRHRGGARQQALLLLAATGRALGPQRRRAAAIVAAATDALAA